MKLIDQCEKDCDYSAKRIEMESVVMKMCATTDNASIVGRCRNGFNLLYRVLYGVCDNLDD